MSVRKGWAGEKGARCCTGGDGQGESLWLLVADLDSAPVGLALLHVGSQRVDHRPGRAVSDVCRAVSCRVVYSVQRAVSVPEVLTEVLLHLLLGLLRIAYVGEEHKERIYGGRRGASRKATGVRVLGCVGGWSYLRRRRGAH